MVFSKQFLSIITSLFLLFHSRVLSYQDQAIADSLRVSSSADTVSALGAIERLGTILSDDDSTNVIGVATTRWGDYTSLVDLSWVIPGAYARDLGSIGQPSQITVRGMGWKNIALLLDGRSVNEPLIGVGNLNLFPLEGIQRIEFETGVRAFLYGLNSTGGTVNLVTKEFYTNRPYSKIRYSEGGYSFLSTDGILSQNLTRRINLAAAFHRRTLEGRYPNSDYDAWNIRFKLRYLLSDRANVVVLESYNRTVGGLNGGVNISKTPSGTLFDELRATMRNTDSFEKVVRHDLNATLGLRLLEDSSSVSLATLFYSNNDREYRDEEDRANANGVLLRSDHRSAWYGIRFNQALREGRSLFTLGGELQRREVNESPDAGSHGETSFSLNGKSELSVSGFRPAVFGRYDRFRGESFVSYGADVKLDPLRSVTVFAGYSTSYRMPTIEELYWKNGNLMRQSPLEKEKHRIIEVGVLSQVRDHLELRASYFRRRVINPLVAEDSGLEDIFATLLLRNAGEEVFEGVDGRIRFNFWRLSGYGAWTFLRHERDGIEKQIYPKFYASGEVAFRTPLFERHLELKVGLRGKFFSEQFGEQYNPEVMMYLENHISSFGPSGTADLFLVGKVRRAYFHLIFENITDQRYMLTPYYPMQDRKLRFGVAWDFLD